MRREQFQSRELNLEQHMFRTDSKENRKQYRGINSGEKIKHSSVPSSISPTGSHSSEINIDKDQVGHADQMARSLKEDECKDRYRSNGNPEQGPDQNNISKMCLVEDIFSWRYQRGKPSDTQAKKASPMTRFARSYKHESIDQPCRCDGGKGRIWCQRNPRRRFVGTP